MPTPATLKSLLSKAHSAYFLPLSFTFLCLLLISSTSLAQWLDWNDETEDRLVLSSVANSDPEEKDIWVADFNNDGWDDVIVVRKSPFSNASSPPRTDLLLMNINGVLTDMTAEYAPEFLQTPTHARDVYVDDFDDDGWPDLIIANTFGQQPMYFRNLGMENGVWQGFVDESAERFPLLTEDEILFCAVWGGDLNGNGAKDLYFCNYKFNASGGIAQDFLLMNDGNGYFTNESQARLGDLRNSAFGTAVQLVDIDNDGDLDVLKVSTLYSVPPWNSMGLFVLFNDGTGNFSNWQNLQQNGAPYMFEAADLNLNGWLDLYVVDDAADRVLYITGANPDVSVSFTQNTLNYPSTNGFGGNVHAADLDLDGYPDVGIADVDVDIPPCNSNRRLALYENSSGNITDPYGTSAQPWAINSYDFFFIDINRDGLLDFITGGCSGYNIFMSANCELAPNNADFDGDGLPDACDPCPTNPDPNCTPPTDFPTTSTDYSMARQWNELTLSSIRRDFARPPVHARNLFHISAAQWDAWSAFDPLSCGYILGQDINGFSCDFNDFPLPQDIEAARDTAIAYASYRILKHRFVNSPQANLLYEGYDNHMAELGFDITFTSTDYSSGSSAALGNYVAQCVIDYGLSDGSNEADDYANTYYEPVNEPLNVDIPGNLNFEDFNRWQPLTLALFIDQSGNLIPGDTPEFLSPEWGMVHPFALTEEDRVVYTRDGDIYPVYLDPGAPPMHSMDGSGTTDLYQWTFMMTSVWGSHLDPADGVMWDISPGAIGNNAPFPETFAEHETYYDFFDGGNAHNGHPVNPYTGQPYPPNIVPRADYARVLAEFWADGPDSETPPGHWFSIFNYVSDHPEVDKRIQGEGDEVNDLEWDVKGYFALGGAVHDAAVAAWSAKGWYDYPRPISTLRGMSDLGQSTNPGGPNYHPGGIPLIEGFSELIEEGDPLAGPGNVNVGKVKVYTWRGHTAINNVDTDVAGVGWILAENWMPYQRPSFVTPPFSGYVSGHSTFSRAAAELLTQYTGTPYFPGGVGEFVAEANEFLVFENGPSVDVVLQWATYYDAADESAASRIWGGIHPPADDIPGRFMGGIAGEKAFAKALTYFEAQACEVPEDCVIESVELTSECYYDSDASTITPAIAVTFDLNESYCVVDEICYRPAGQGEYTCINLSEEGFNAVSGSTYTITDLLPETEYEVYCNLSLFASAPSTSEVQTSVTPDCSDQVPGCTNDLGINYDPDATVDDGSCDFDCPVNPPACIDPDSDAYIEVISNNISCCTSAWDLTCQQAYDLITNTCIEGCTSALACNFNPNAAIEDGSCVFPGCMDEEACNYAPTAGCDDGSCVFEQTWYLDLDGDGYGTDDVVIEGTCETPCDDTWVVTISSEGWLDETTWTLSDADNTVIAAGGPYGNGGTFTGQGTSSNGPFTLFIETQGQYNDNSPSYSVTTGSGIELASGTVGGGQTFTEGGIICSFAPEGGDCDDTNPLVNPGMEEDPCNGIDDNCDGNIDGIGGFIWYADNDGDGYGNDNETIISCDEPCDGVWIVTVTSTGWMDEITWELRDADNTVVASGGPYGNTQNGGTFTGQGNSTNGPFSFFIETEGNFGDNQANWTITSGGGLEIIGGFAAPATATTTTDIDCIYVSQGGDCDDTNPDINPGVEDTPCNGIDDNCDGIVDSTSIYGCDDPLACNFNPDVNCFDESCDYSCNGCPGDFNDDGVRDIMDLLMLLAEVGCQGDCICDMDGDGLVTVNDMLMFLPYFGVPCD